MPGRPLTSAPQDAWRGGGPPEHPPQLGALGVGPGTREYLSRVCPRVLGHILVGRTWPRGPLPHPLPTWMGAPSRCPRAPTASSPGVQKAGRPPGAFGGLWGGLPLCPARPQLGLLPACGRHQHGLLVAGPGRGVGEHVATGLPSQSLPPPASRHLPVALLSMTRAGRRLCCPRGQQRGNPGLAEPPPGCVRLCFHGGQHVPKWAGWAEEKGHPSPPKGSFLKPHPGGIWVEPSGRQLSA